MVSENYKKIESKIEKKILELKKQSIGLNSLKHYVFLVGSKIKKLRLR